MKRYFWAFFLFLFSSAYSQNIINNYKYVIVPAKFSFLKAKDQYLLNSMAKQLLENKGFTVFFDDAKLPGEIANDKCNALSADVLSKGNWFTTSLVLILKDCHGNTVFESKVGTNREKDFNTAYSKALRDAFVSLYQLGYAYNGANGKSDQPVTETVATTAPIVAEKQPITTISEKATQPDQQLKTLYAQAIPNGYQLIDTTPKKVLTLLKTSAENYFIANNDIVSGIVFKINQDWFFEYYSNSKLISQKLLIKF